MYSHSTALKTGPQGHSPFREKTARGMVTTPSTANIKYLVKITRAGAINANQLTVQDFTKRRWLEKQVRKAIQHPTYLFSSYS